MASHRLKLIAKRADGAWLVEVAAKQILLPIDAAEIEEIVFTGEPVVELQDMLRERGVRWRLTSSS